MLPHDFAVELLFKARADEYTIDKLIDDPAVDNAIVGFHCQQAAEKLLKALLAERGTYFQKSHDLGYLTNLVNTGGEPLPVHLCDLDLLNPFAVTLRYEAWEATANFDRTYAREMVRQLDDWVDGKIGTHGT